MNHDSHGDQDEPQERVEVEFHSLTVNWKVLDGGKVGSHSL